MKNNNYKPSSNLEDLISNLERHELTSNSGGQDMEKSLNGDYVLFTDVIKLISELKNKLWN